MCEGIKEASGTIFASLVWLDLGLNPGFPGHRWTPNHCTNGPVTISLAKKELLWLWYKIASDTEVLVLKILGGWNTQSLPLLPGPLLPRVALPVWASYIGLFNVFKNDSGSYPQANLCQKMHLGETYKKDANMNLQYWWFPNTYA